MTGMSQRHGIWLRYFELHSGRGQVHGKAVSSAIAMVCLFDLPLLTGRLEANNMRFPLNIRSYLH